MPSWFKILRTLQLGFMTDLLLPSPRPSVPIEQKGFLSLERELQENLRLCFFLCLLPGELTYRTGNRWWGLNPGHSAFSAVSPTHLDLRRVQSLSLPAGS